MIVGVAVVIVLLLIGMMVLNIEHGFRKVKVIAIIIIGLLLVFSVYSLFSSDRVDLSSPGGVVNAVYIYFGWIGQTAGNLWHVATDTFRITGQAVKINPTSNDTSEEESSGGFRGRLG